MSFKNLGLAILALNPKRSLSFFCAGAVCSFSFWITPVQAQDANVAASGATVNAPDGSGAPAPDNSQWVESWANDLKQSSQSWIQIDISDQRLIAWEGSTPVFSITVSTGRASDMTPTGVYAIENKYRTARMQGDNYDIPDVPYTMYFSGSYAIHGAYWHTNFGSPVSSGCINVPVQGAAWLYDWAGAGIAVVVQN